MLWSATTLYFVTFVSTIIFLPSILVRCFNVVMIVSALECFLTISNEFHGKKLSLMLAWCLFVMVFSVSEHRMYKILTLNFCHGGSFMWF